MVMMMDDIADMMMVIAYSSTVAVGDIYGWMRGKYWSINVHWYLKAYYVGYRGPDRTGQGDGDGLDDIAVDYRDNRHGNSMYDSDGRGYPSHCPLSSYEGLAVDS